MTQALRSLSPREWILVAATGLLGTLILFDAPPGLNWGIWIAAAAGAALICRRPKSLRLAKPAIVLAAAATITAFAAAFTTEESAYAGIVALTAVLLACLLTALLLDSFEELTALSILRSPFSAIARVATAAPREISTGARALAGSPSRTILRRVLLVGPIVVVLVILLASADPIFHLGIQSVQNWLPNISIGGQTIFFLVLTLVLIGACSPLPEWRFGLQSVERPSLRRVLPAGDAKVLVTTTLGVLIVFLALQVLYWFIKLPSQIGSGITYAEYARRGFGELCVVVTIVAAVILLTERFRESPAPTEAKNGLQNLELCLVVAAALVLVSAQTRIVLYEHAYGYTTARVHATAFIVFMAGFLALLGVELRTGPISASLGRRAAALALVIALSILYWNDHAWIMNRNIDRARATGKFDTAYALSLSLDAVPTLLARRNELPADAWGKLWPQLRCGLKRANERWYTWNYAYTAAESAIEESDRHGQPVGCGKIVPAA